MRPGFRDLGLGGVRDLVIDDLFGLVAVVAVAAVAAIGGAAGAGQFVADRHRSAIVVAVRRFFLARLARTHDAAVRIVFVRGLGDAVEVEVGGDLHARMAGADDRIDDGLDLAAHAVLVGELALVGIAAAERTVGAGAVGEQTAGLVDDRNAVGLQAVDGAGDEMADRAHLLRLELAAHLQHDRCGGLDRIAREQRPVRQHEMHARGLDPVDRADGARRARLRARAAC